MKYTLENTALIDKPVDVYLDGVLVEECIEADTDDGYVVGFGLNDRATSWMYEKGVVFELARGKVEVKPRGKNGKT